MTELEIIERLGKRPLTDTERQDVIRNIKDLETSLAIQKGKLKRDDLWLAREDGFRLALGWSK